MRRTIEVFTLAVLLTAAASGAARSAVEVVSPADTAPTAVDPLVWGEANVRANGAIEINEANSRGAGAPGSLEMRTDNPPIVNGQDKADFEIFFSDPTLTLGTLDSLLFDWYRDSSSTVSGILAPVLRIYFMTASGDQGLLIWEATYQSQYPGAVPVDQWVAEDILSGVYWQRAFGPGRTINRYDLTLQDWIAQGAVSDGSNTGWDIDADTRVLGINVGFGSGWGGGDFLAWVDLVTLGFSGASTTWDFGVLSGVGICPAMPAPGCLLNRSGSAWLFLRDSISDPRRNRLRFGWKSGSGATPGDTGSPEVADRVQLCIYEEVSAVPGLVMAPEIAPQAGWRSKRFGYRWRAPAADSSGLKGARLRVHPNGKTRIRVAGKGANLVLPGLPLSQEPAVEVQLHSDSGECWSARFSTPPARKSRGALRYRAD